MVTIGKDDLRPLSRDEVIEDVEARIPERIRRMAASEDCTCGGCVRLVGMSPAQRRAEVGRDYDEASVDSVAIARGGWMMREAWREAWGDLTTPADSDERDPFTGALILEDALGERQ
jgi:hypothetical protein